MLVLLKTLSRKVAVLGMLSVAFGLPKLTVVEAHTERPTRGGATRVPDATNTDATNNVDTTGVINTGSEPVVSTESPGVHGSVPGAVVCGQVLSPGGEGVVPVPVHESHPHFGSQFQLLPNLFQREPTPKGVMTVEPTPLVAMANQIADVKQVAGNVFFGPVYPQTVPNYITNAGHVVDNKAGYWPASFSEVDPKLGSKEDYIRVKKAAENAGLGWVQDFCSVYFGYNPVTTEQIDFYAKTIRALGGDPAGHDLTQEFYYRNQWILRSDPKVFNMPPGSRADWNPGISDLDFATAEQEEPNPFAFQEAMDRIATLDYAGLRRFNDETTLDWRIDDHLWYVREAHVSNFRIDAAKHFKPVHLAHLFDRLRKAVAEYVPSKPQAKFFLEFWTTRYRVMDWLKEKLGAKAMDGVYFYDYPMAQAIRDGVLERRGFQSIAHQIGVRKKFNINMSELVGLFTDHDFMLPPYDGSKDSLASLAAGHILTWFLGQNEPTVYNGFEKPEFFRGENVVGGEGREFFTKIIDRSSEAVDVVASIRAKMTDPLYSEVLRRSGDIFVNKVDNDHIVLERRLEDSGKKLVLHISLGGDPGVEKSGSVVWEYVNTRVSTRLYYESWK